MFVLLPESEGKTIGFRATGKLTDEDYKTVLIPKVEELIKTHGKGRILVIVDSDFKGWDLGAFWDDAKFGMAHRNDFEKMALVGDTKWSDWGAKISKWFVSGEVQHFDMDQLAQAWEWVKA